LEHERALFRFFLHFSGARDTIQHKAEAMREKRWGNHEITLVRAHFI